MTFKGNALLVRESFTAYAVGTAIIRVGDTATKNSKILSFEILSNQKKEL